MKRYAIFAILGPPLAAATLFLILLPLAGLLRGTTITISTSVMSVYSYAVSAALVVAFFDWIAALIELPGRPIGTAVVGWIFAYFLLSEYLALPDLTGWFVAIGMLGAVPGFICSWLTVKLDAKKSVNA
jgi:hypothetical protein